MFEKWKEKREQTMARNRAIAESQYWKTHPQLQTCLRAMRGSCTLAPVEMHEAAVAVVNIAMQEDTWQNADRIPEGFPGNTVYLVWDDPKLPVLKAPWPLVEARLTDIRAVSCRTFLVAETLDRIIAFDDAGSLKLYSVA